MGKVSSDTAGASDEPHGQAREAPRLESLPRHATPTRMPLGSLQQPMALDAGFQNYAWGDPRFIPDLFRFAATGAPFAEAWFGAHPLLPSTLHVEGGLEPLDRALAAHPRELLGSKVAEGFGGLPFLLKVLAANQPLSIQVHPSREQAELGFERDEASGLALDAPNRNYRDRNHKPELLVALTPFFALAGFRPLEQVRGLLEGVPELSALLPPLDEQVVSLEALTHAYLHLAPASRNSALGTWIDRVRHRSSDYVPGDWEYWALAADDVTRSGDEPDAGLFFFLLLNLVELAPRQGLFLPAGVPHAYLRGAGVEVMATSDNVLRCGLTKKHTDPAELMSIVRFDAVAPRLFDPAPLAAGRQRTFETAASEFQVQTFDFRQGETSAQLASGPEIVLVANREGRLVVSCEGAPSLLREGGQACFVPHGVSYAVEAVQDTTAVRVSVPYV